MKSFAAPLALTWAGLCLGFAYASAHVGAGAHASGGRWDDAAWARRVAAQFALVHVGLLMGVSMTETWVKFKAPLLERHVGFDVGRHVFAALNTVEVVLTTSAVGALAWRGQLVAEPDASRAVVWLQPVAVVPVAALAVVLLQALYLTPALELRSLHIIVEQLAHKQHASRAEEKLYKELKAATALSTPPGKWVHHVYVVLEVAKIVGQAYFAMVAA